MHYDDIQEDETQPQQQVNSVSNIIVDDNEPAAVFKSITLTDNPAPLPLNVYSYTCRTWRKLHIKRRYDHTHRRRCLWPEHGCGSGINSNSMKRPRESVE